MGHFYPFKNDQRRRGGAAADEKQRVTFSNEYLLLTCKIWRRYSREGASQSLPNIRQKLEKKS